MAKAAGEYSTRAGSRSSPPLRGPHWISLREEVEREWRRLGWSDPAMGKSALAAIDGRLKSGELPSKLIEGNREKRVARKRWRKDLCIRADGVGHWLDDEQRVEVPDLSTLRVKSRCEPDRQLLVLVWAPPEEATLSTAAGDEASGASVEPQSKRQAWKGKKVREALQELYPDGAPLRIELSDSALCNAVYAHLGIRDDKTISKRTILRIAGRAK
jgi:hypothetical protein